MERVTRLGCVFSPTGRKQRSRRRPAAGEQQSTGLPHLIVRAFDMLRKRKKPLPFGNGLYGAGDEARTRYLHLGKVALYRMSYTRNGLDYYSTGS